MGAKDVVPGTSEIRPATGDEDIECDDDAPKTKDGYEVISIDDVDEHKGETPDTENAPMAGQKEKKRATHLKTGGIAHLAEFPRT